MEAVEQALALCEEDAGPPHLKLVLEWDLQGKERYVTASSAVAVVWVVFVGTYAVFNVWPRIPMRYEGHLESKKRFAIKKYLLIIGKKKNMQVLSHTFTYFST